MPYSNSIKEGTTYIETTVQNNQEFMDLATLYGVPIKSRRENDYIDTIIARKEEDVQKNSLSKRFGMSNFPIHTDGAYLRVPPKYILMRYIGTAIAPSPTIIVHFDLNLLNEEEMDFIQNAIYFVKGNERGFYSKIYENDLLRYDSQVMRLLNQGMDDKMSSILEKMPTSMINWEVNKVVVINNWKVLHFRPALKFEERNTRILQRINIL